MLFNSIEFAIFLPIIFLLYWYVSKNNLKLQNILLLFASCFFYACWDYRFLFLLLFSILLDYYTGIQIHNAKKIRVKKAWFWFSIVVNIGFLGLFKYYNFFIESFATGLSALGVNANTLSLKLILPVGISFYTFHGLSYLIDIYKDRIKPEKDFINYALFVSFFPLLVAGPIERATHLLPQIDKKRKFSYSSAVDGMRQILWGLFKKIVVADNCAIVANNIFDNYQEMNGAVLLIGGIFFAFQIYGDFSGYSDIAIGTARLFGINLLKNFSYPYFSRDIAEFWRKWHISLTTWFRDYIYIPLGGSRVSKWKVLRNTFIIFLVSGFWHGANWTFLVWGAIHALLYIPLILSGNNRKNTNLVASNTWYPSFKEFFQMFFTFNLVVFAWIFFRAETIEKALLYFNGMFEIVTFEAYTRIFNYQENIFILILILVEWFQRRKEHGLDIQFIKQTWLRRFIYLVIVLMIVWFMGKNESFIYFQF